MERYDLVILKIMRQAISVIIHKSFGVWLLKMSKFIKNHTKLSTSRTVFEKSSGLVM